MLTMEGHEVLAAETGEQAMNFMRQFHPQVVLMNMLSSIPTCQPPSGKSGGHGQYGEEPVVFLTAGCGGDFLTGFMGDEEKRTVFFDHLPTRVKIGVIEHVQQLCSALGRCQRLTTQERRLMHPTSGDNAPDFAV
jgi:hypothetical protein